MNGISGMWRVGWGLGLIVAAGIGLSCVSAIKGRDARAEAQVFIDAYTVRWQELAYTANEMEWRANTRIVPGDDTNEIASAEAAEALATFTGSRANIETARALLARKDDLEPLQVRQLEVILYQAANNPATVPHLVKERIEAETRQTSDLFGFDFKIGDSSVSTNDIDRILRESTDLDERRQAWEASKEVGAVLKDGLARLRDLRNNTVRDLGYRSYFHYQVSDYGMTVAEMLEMLDRLVHELRPLYRELHTYARYELARRYGVEPVPELLPAHWLPNRWAQDWSSMVSVEGLDLKDELETRGREWLLKQAERFYVSLGFSPLPASFWTKSSLYPLPEGAPFKKNNHASAWHMDYERDVRCLMSVVPDRDWYETTHHELGHIYYYLCYANDEVPLLLRDGANRAYHEAVGSQLGMAAMQAPFLSHIGLLPGETQIDEMEALLKEALNHVVFIPFAAGTMTRFEYELYEALPRDRFNARWWEIARRYQGIVPPTSRGEEYCDAASKTHINNDAAQYYDYALSVVLLFQFHDHIARNILHQDPRKTNYYGSHEVGEFLRRLLAPGASRDWRELLEETVGGPMSAEPMMRYFEPLLGYLRKKNEGRTHTLPAL